MRCLSRELLNDLDALKLGMSVWGERQEVQVRLHLMK